VGRRTGGLGSDLGDAIDDHLDASTRFRGDVMTAIADGVITGDEERLLVADAESDRETGHRLNRIGQLAIASLGLIRWISGVGLTPRCARQVHESMRDLDRIGTALAAD
jgi:hypothetical protein